MAYRKSFRKSFKGRGKRRGYKGKAKSIKKYRMQRGGGRM